MERIEKIKELMEYEEKLLYYQASIYLSSDYTSTEGPSLSKGKEFFKNISKELKQKVCIEFKLCSKINNSEFNTGIDLIAAISDFISSVSIGQPVPSVIIATIIFKIGIKKFCDCNE